MTKQEEIREGIKERIGDALISIGCGDGGCPHAEQAVLKAQEDCLNSILNYLHSQGVVIKVERELLDIIDKVTSEYLPHTQRWMLYDAIRNTGFTAWESLI